ncbi:hypothetical protein [Sunxiuqinia elliptica]|uniref:Uncharacterized protein n=1 Tax=Sunxiuqinia elliptica TaxID=655355 RepID=A0A4R6HAC3_9BACT|nr:hypothetical protein [Sunxiuqinia elliptica]TDO05094.1 hypothetical protein DET52_101450 [Sunxiuqinia elliptica]TDO64643.1 hypothetical protein DET65_1009 [Sunxiuqinia elliptica]
MIGKFFHLPNHRRFNIPYRYFNPEKEEMEERESRIKKEMGIHEKKESDENYRPNIRGQFRRSMGDSSKTASDARKSSNTRLIMLIAILSLAVYLFFKF